MAWGYLRFSTLFWQTSSLLAVDGGYLNLLPFGLERGLTPPSPMQSRPLFIPPFPPPFLFFPSLSLLTSSPFVQRSTIVTLSASCFPLVHSFTRRNKTNPRENQRRNEEHPIVNISFNCFSNSPPCSLVVGKIPSQPLYSYSGKRARSFFPCPSKVAAFGYILP